MNHYQDIISKIEYENSIKKLQKGEWGNISDQKRLSVFKKLSK